LDIESDIEIGNFNPHDIDELLELFSEAVEYYNSQRDRKYLYYE